MQMMPHGHGGDTASLPPHTLDFSANLNPCGLPPGVAEAAAEAIRRPGYPDPFCRELTGMLAETQRLPAHWILCGSGAADLIYRLVWAVRPRRALLVSPCFSEYERALQTIGCPIRFHPLRPEENFQISPALLGDLHGIDLVFLCNPNNPTGLLCPPDLLEAVLRRCAQEQILLVLDECFLELTDFPERTAISFLDRAPLVILKAFTKTYAMAGLRLGYCLCRFPSLLESMRRAGPPWNVSSPAQAAGIAALQAGKGYLETSRRLIRKQRMVLWQGLESLGFRVWDSKANFLFFRGTKGLYSSCLQAGIHLRACENYRGLEDGSYYRIAVRTPEENRQLLGRLQQLLSQEGRLWENQQKPL